MTLDLRSKYFLPDDGAVELRAFTHGLMPRTVPSMMQHFVDDWRELGVDAWNEVPNHWLPEAGETVGWWSLPEYLGDRFISPLLGAPVGTCIMQPNVHWTTNTLFSDVGRFRGKRIILTEDAFPSVLQPAKQWAELVGFDVVRVPLDVNGFVDRSAVLKAVDEKTAAVVLSHVGFTTGERLPDPFLQEVAHAAHQAGGLVLIDGYHAVGSMPVRVNGLAVDVYFGGLLKEASGASGNAFVYVREGLEIRPRLTGWFGHDDPFGFEAEPTPATEVRRRFLGGTTAVASMYHAVEGVRLLLEAGLENVRANSLAKTGYCLERAQSAGIRIRSPLEEDRRSAMVILEVERAAAIVAHLKTLSIYTDSRLGCNLRMAPFVWNTALELEHAFDALATSLRTGVFADRGSGGGDGPVP